MELKVALCLSGQPRGLINAYQYVFNSLILRYDVDVFCHSWFQNEEKELQMILKLYNPKLYNFQKDWQLKLKKDNYRIGSARHPAYYTFSGYKSMMESVVLKKQYEIDNNFKYDVVIRSRYDYALNKKFVFEDEDMSLMHVPNCLANQEKTVCTDQFAFSNSNNMDKYSMVYENIDSYHDLGCKINGEELLIMHLDKNNLLKEKLKYHEMNHPFYGGMYNSGPHSLVRDDIQKYLK